MANLNLNKVILGGRLTADPELRTTASGVSVVSFTVAVNRRFTKPGEEQQTDFINCTAWRQTAEFIARYFHKASSICVVGSIQTRSWTDQSGQKRFATDVVVDEAMFVDSRTEREKEIQREFEAFDKYGPTYDDPDSDPEPPMPEAQLTNYHYPPDEDLPF